MRRGEGYPHGHEQEPLTSRGMEVLFIDAICLSSLWRAARLGHPRQGIWHCEPLTASGRRWIEVFRRLNLLHAEVHQIPYHVGYVRDEHGSRFLRLYQDGRTLSARVKAVHIDRDPLLQAMASIWDPRKVALHLYVLAQRELTRECLRIGLVEWMARTHFTCAPAQCTLLIVQHRWYSYLAQYAHATGIPLKGYRPVPAGQVLRIARKAFRVIGRACRLDHAFTRSVRRVGPVTTLNDVDHPIRSAASPARSVTVAFRSWYRPISFDPTERTEFFCLEEARVPTSDVMLYDYASERRLDAGTLQELRRRGIRLLGRAPGIPAWRPRFHFVKLFLRVAYRLLGATIQRVVRERADGIGSAPALLALAWDYAYWHDMFAAHRVGLHVSPYFTTAGQVLALDTLNGVSLTYQLSLTVLTPTDELFSSGEDVQCVFSPAMERLWRELEPVLGRFVHTGFLYDRGVQATRALDRPITVRERLRAHGAQFIICFFDENSMNRWDSFPSDAEASADYQYLLEWLLDDPTLGLVCKPKISSNLFDRIGRLAPLLAQAQATGRCEFLMGHTLVSGIYPAEAARIADICVGKLLGSSAAFEACLVGRPTALIDREALYDHPFYAWGRGRVIFETWTALRRTVEQYRASPASHPTFGDWSPGLEALDPFRDGRTSQRMGGYVQWIWHALSKGLSKEGAVAFAHQQYAQMWGPPASAFDSEPSGRELERFRS